MTYALHLNDEAELALNHLQKLRREYHSDGIRVASLEVAIKEVLLTAFENNIYHFNAIHNHEEIDNSIDIFEKANSLKEPIEYYDSNEGEFGVTALEHMDLGWGSWSLHGVIVKLIKDAPDEPCPIFDIKLELVRQVARNQLQAILQLSDKHPTMTACELCHQSTDSKFTKKE